MKIALFGATGPTGAYIINEALKQGHTLSVYTRDANKLKLFDGKIRIVVGDLKNLDVIKRCIEGTDAVISALGPNSIKAKKDRPVMNGLKNIISAMAALHIHRIVQISTAASSDPNDKFDFKIRLNLALIKLIALGGYDDVKATGELIRGSNVDWTLVRIPNLKDGPADGRITVGMYGTTKLRMTLSRGNLAKFLIDQVSSPNFIRAAPAIADF